LDGTNAIQYGESGRAHQKIPSGAGVSAILQEACLKLSLLVNTSETLKAEVKCACGPDGHEGSPP
jgi:hypothetical protein